MDESVVKEFEQQQVGTLKLSQAIRIGAKLRPQCHEWPFQDGKSCAIGAAYEALTGEYLADKQRTAEVYMFIKLIYGDNSTWDIWPKNDAGWTREAVADWLEAQGH